MSGYNQLSLSERKKIEEALNEGKSFRIIAQLLGRNVSTVSREVKTNRFLKAAKARKSICRERNWCKRVGICDRCHYEGAYCVYCDKVDCRDVCSSYEEQIRCDILSSAPWVCNSCRKNRYGCNRTNRYVYSADVADSASSGRRSESRQGINTANLDMDFIENTLRDALKRKMSPYEIATLYAEVCKVSTSTLYRWIEAGIGDTCNLDLKRKIGFKPRRGERKKQSTSHSQKRNYEAFCKLSAERQASALEMDCVLGFRRNSQTLLTLFHRPSHLQIAILLKEHSAPKVIEALEYVRSMCDEGLFNSLCETVITDNGHEFADEDALEYVFSRQRSAVHLFYCDPRRSDQKARCEKGHTEIRQLLPKGKVDFDELDAFDIAVANSHANSTPRLSLCGMCPVDMFLAAYKKPGKELLDNLGIEKIDRDKLCLSPLAINIEREKRGLEPLTEF